MKFYYSEEDSHIYQFRKSRSLAYLRANGHLAVVLSPLREKRREDEG